MEQKVQIENEAGEKPLHAAQQPLVLFAYSYYPHCALPQGGKDEASTRQGSFLQLPSATYSFLLLLLLLPFLPASRCYLKSFLGFCLPLCGLTHDDAEDDGVVQSEPTTWRMRNLRGSTSNKLHSNKAEKVHEAVQEQQREFS